MTAVVLGAGGAARAVCAALLDGGCPRIIVVNRNRARAGALARAFESKITVADWHARTPVLAEADLLINTTSLGMAGQPSLDLNLDATIERFAVPKGMETQP